MLDDDDDDDDDSVGLKLQRELFTDEQWLSTLTDP